ncbi:ribosome recycling factor [Leptospira kirschneri]|uniref:Ribosome-recycling factor n=3 Tax=Leptospira kirschneri TaxID=29507 RepID=A0A1T1DWQ3_9LEPT|nr:ribosome recycling factor [Leptospira kirschneri]EMO77161.1 ribosome recycling factor [Leptospira kirschneri str. 200801925]EJO69188.1 ribosome recycling factor [Leptospira kirschneri serovar Grippotyphosa str. RM52]EKO52437.1 ribosome recycling factor [Leptospira kirschneri str. 200802841]EKP05832.1 ribosome recycling factor [Leptospira kirschneri str. 2008720114]EKQ83702.1 ribosome recycling factor [Leptospira kirschneri serovar Grippotyphosa str. Moskva]
MASDAIISGMKTKMDKTIELVKKDFGTIRTGRANPSLVEDIRVDYYGTQTPINQLGNISVPEPRILVISPYDKGIMKDIEKAIQTSGLGLQPTNDGVVIRIVIPELTGERRKELAKVVKSKSEEKKVAIRNIRRDAMEDLKKHTEGMSQDEIKSVQDQIQKITDSYIDKISSLTAEKEKEITTI